MQLQFTEVIKTIEKHFLNEKENYFERYVMNQVLEILTCKLLLLFRRSSWVDSWIVKSGISGRGPGWRNRFWSEQSEMVFKAMGVDRISGTVSTCTVERRSRAGLEALQRTGSLK